MPSKHISRAACIASALFLCGVIYVLSDATNVQADERHAATAERPASTMFVLEAKKKKQWRRGNLHTHSHWSDGDDYLPNIAKWYRDQGYQFLVFTDHNVLANKERWVDVKKAKGKQVAFDKLITNFPNDVETRTVKDRLETRLHTFDEVAKMFNKPNEFLLIQGEEISDRFQRYPIHLNASNLDKLITPRGGHSVAETIQNNVSAVIRQREQTGKTIMVHVNHPNFQYAVTAEDLMKIVGERFFEVYNGHPGVHNSGDHQHVSMDRMWDIILTKRLTEFELPVMYGIAVDDGHNYHNIPSRASEPGRGWVMVLADELSPKSLIDALERGDFYASSGVTLKRITSSLTELTVEIEPVEGESFTTEFIGTRVGYDRTSTPVLDKDGKEMRATRKYSDDIGEVLKTQKGTTARYRFQGDEIYVRARITSSAHHPNPSEVHDHQKAWLQPVVLKKTAEE